MVLLPGIDKEAISDGFMAHSYVFRGWEGGERLKFNCFKDAKILFLINLYQ